MTFVLVHGGGYDHRCWDPLLRYLPGDTVAIDLPGRGNRPAALDTLRVSDFVDAVVDELTSRELADVVLVGHSLAGITLPGVAVRAPDRIAQLAFVSCAIPPPGTSMMAALGDLSPAAAELVARLGNDLVAADGTLHPDMARAMFCNDMDDEQFRFAIDVMVPESSSVIAEVLSGTGLPPALPCTYVRLLQDASLTLETQDEMLSRLGEPQVIDLDAGHMAMITQPAALAAILRAL